MTFRQALTLATGQLAANPSLRDHAHRDAELLLLHVLGIDRATLLAYPTRLLTDQQLIAYQAAIARRLNHEPIQYITGQQEFFGLQLKVTPATLIPRPETEHLVEAVLDRLTNPDDQPLDPLSSLHKGDRNTSSRPERPPQRHVISTEGGAFAAAVERPLYFSCSPSPYTTGGTPLRILDIGTGTGAIALALAAHLPHSRITAVDLSAEALEVARQNAAAHHLGGRVDFILSDLLTGLPRKDQTAAFDAIVSNPPYIPQGDRAGLHPEVRDFEPAQALFAGALGLDIYRRLIPQAHAALKPGGLLALEIGHGQRDLLADLLRNWQNISFIDDLQQVPRVALAWR